MVIKQKISESFSKVSSFLSTQVKREEGRGGETYSLSENLFLFLYRWSVLTQMIIHTRPAIHYQISRKTQKISLFLNLINKIMNDEPVLLWLFYIQKVHIFSNLYRHFISSFYYKRNELFTFQFSVLGCSNDWGTTKGLYTPSPHLPAIIELTRTSAFLHYQAKRNGERDGPGHILGQDLFATLCPLRWWEMILLFPFLGSISVFCETFTSNLWGSPLHLSLTWCSSYGIRRLKRQILLAACKCSCHS